MARGLNGMTVSDARGTGNSPESGGLFGGEDALIHLSLRARLEAVVEADRVEELVAAIREAAWTGDPGDGKIFVEPVAEAIRLRTGERGRDAL